MDIAVSGGQLPEHQRKMGRETVSEVADRRNDGTPCKMVSRVKSPILAALRSKALSQEEVERLAFYVRLAAKCETRGGIDYSKIRVDGGGHGHTGLSDAVIDAQGILSRAMRWLDKTMPVHWIKRSDTLLFVSEAFKALCDNPDLSLADLGDIASGADIIRDKRTYERRAKTVLKLMAQCLEPEHEKHRQLLYPPA